MACIGTGPSLTTQQVETSRAKGFALAGCNLVYQMVPDLRLLFATNEGFWVHYWDEIRTHPCEKWTNNDEAARRFGINHIRGIDRRGLSVKPDRLHHGHSSGYQLLGLAYLMGAKRIVLLGYDMRYAPDYDGRERKVGSVPRHYFGEYPSGLRHWPKVSVREGVHFELVNLYRSVADQGLVEIINCTPGSALDCFPMADIDAV